MYKGWICAGVRENQFCIKLVTQIDLIVCNCMYNVTYLLHRNRSHICTEFHTVGYVPMAQSDRAIAF